jgi:transcriptional regulator with XRE-family HTH domain
VSWDTVSYDVTVHSPQFRALLTKAEISQSELARQLEISDRTVRRYVAGASPVPRAVIHYVLQIIDRNKRKT